MNSDQDRRPGLRQLAETIAKKHPDWTKSRCAAVAKTEWTMQTFDRLASAERRDLKTMQEDVRTAARKSL